MASSVNSLFKQLSDAIAGKPDVVPKGYKTTQQWANEWGISRPHANKLICAGVSQGIMGKKTLRTRRDDGRVIGTLHYFQK